MKKISFTIKLRQLLILAVVFICVSGFQCGIGASSGGGSTGWKVWVKTSPCAGGRTDWVSVAKQNPTEGGGGSFHFTADRIMGGLPCTTVGDESCTFDKANEVATKIRASSQFANYCCRDYSVWKNTQTGEMSVVKGMGSAGFGWQFEKGNLCCEEAAKLAGKPELCPDTHDGGNQPKAGLIGCYKDQQPYDLDGFLGRSQTNTPQECMETCRAKGFAYAGVQYGESCLCGNSYGKYGTANNCDYKCTGDGSQICGGYNANSVYTTGFGGGSGGRTKPHGGNNGSDDGIIPTPTSTPMQTPYSTPMQTPTPTAGRWTLVSTTVIPETPDTKMGWSFSGANATSATITVYQGDKHFFQWTRPPNQIDESGFSLTGSVQCQSVSGCATLMNLGGSGLESDTPRNQWVAEANGRNGQNGSGQKTIYFKPSPNAGDLEVEIGLQWGAVRFKYKYQRL